MKACAVYVVQRAYGQPGPCQSRRALAHVVMSDLEIVACYHHRMMIKAGHKLPLAIAKRNWH